MKNIYFTLLFFTTLQIALGQEIGDKDKFMFATISSTSPTPFINIDTLHVISNVNDTLSFEMASLSKKNTEFFKTDNRVYLVSTDTICLYDYNLVSGDTFVLKLFQDTEYLVVDSVKMIQMEDGNMHKHWFLHSQSSDPIQKFQHVWIENFGDKSLGWNYTNYKHVHLPSIVSICTFNQGLLYWNLQNAMSFPPAKTCNFDSVRKAVGFEDLNRSKINVYPNPASEVIHIEYPFEFHYHLLDTYGRLVLEGKGNDAVEIKGLAAGIYILNVESDGAFFQEKLLINP